MRIPKKRIKEVYIPDDEDMGMVVIRNLSLEEVAVIESEFVEFGANGPAFTNFAKRTAKMVFESIQGWGNIKDENGTEIPFTRANLEMASALVIVSKDDNGEETRQRFYEWINEEREKFAEELIEEEKKAKGN